MLVTMDNHDWTPVPGYEGLYDVSRAGSVRNSRTGRILRGLPNNQGRLQVALYRNARSRRKQVSRIVCEAFHGPAPAGKPYALHNDGDPLNNRSENIRWGSQSENQLDAVVHGTHSRATRTQCPYGHNYSAENTYVTKLGQRQCRTCNARRERDRRAITAARR